MSTIITEFLLDEDAAFAAKEQGSYFPSNHHRIRPEFKKVFKKLDPQTLQRYYFHSLRIHNFPFDVNIETWPFFIKSIEQLGELLKRKEGYPICTFTSFQSLLLFGYDGVRVATVDPNFDLQSYSDRLGLYKKANQYSNIPGILNKVAKLLEFTENSSLVKHIHWTLRQSGFKHEGVFASNFLFWTMMSIVMLINDEESKKTIELFKSADIPEKPNHLEIFQRFEIAIGNLKK